MGDADTDADTYADTVARDTGDTSVRYDTGEPLLTWEQVDIGSSFTMACGIVSDGTIRCWGAPACTQYAPPATVEMLQVSVGGANACGLRRDGTVQCWCCELSSYPEVCTESPPGSFTRIELGLYHACAQDAAGYLTCWGAEELTTDVPAEPFGDFDLDANYTAAITPAGELKWWPNWTDWPQGEGPPDGVPLADISIGRRHACALSVDGTPYCWGTDLELDPWESPPPGTYQRVVTFNEGTCFIDLAGGLSCWWGLHIQALDVWAFQLPTDPVAQVGLGEWDGCAVTLTGDAVCWGGPLWYEPMLDPPNLNP
jgi:hypothetical protein